VNVAHTVEIFGTCADCANRRWQRCWRCGGRPQQASETAARLLAAGEATGFASVLRAARSAKHALDAEVLATALESKSDEVVTETIWYFVSSYASDPSKMPEVLRAPATAARDGAGGGGLCPRAAAPDRRRNARRAAGVDGLAWQP
jgi:hypothetical protein